MGNRQEVKDQKYEVEKDMIKYVLENAKKGDPDNILRTIDKFYWDGDWLVQYVGQD
jgi:hypothetical protein